MKNYFALHKLVSVEADTAVHVSFYGESETSQFDPEVGSREDWLKLLDSISIYSIYSNNDYLNPVEQPSFEDQLAQARWTASADQINEWNKQAAKFYRQNSELVDPSESLATLPIEDLENRIL